MPQCPKHLLPLQRKKLGLVPGANLVLDLPSSDLWAQNTSVLPANSHIGTSLAKEMVFPGRIHWNFSSGDIFDRWYVILL